MVFEDNEVELDDEKVTVYAKRSDVYMNNQQSLFKCGCCVEASGSGGNKAHWEVADDHIVEETKYSY